MPSWKKVITSGSNAQLNQITASGFNLVGTGTAELEVQGQGAVLAEKKRNSKAY